MDSRVKDLVDKILTGTIPGLFGDGQISYEKEADQYRIKITTSGHYPEDLDIKEISYALQHILRITVHKKFPDDRTHFLIDIDDFRNQREEKIRKLIPSLAENKVIIQGKTVVLMGLSGYERMIVHHLLSDIKGLETTSVGNGRSRKLLIMPDSETGASGMDQAIMVDINTI
jgi:predicted RNA-binding protein Jag